jgi:hypothetical protein
VEVLKDGGATTYGADAVGGVVNYITRHNLDGVEANGNYRYIKDSDGDYDADVSAGKIGDNWNIMGVVGYIHRSPLKLSDRDWALKDFLYNPTRGTAPAPGAYTFQRTSTGCGGDHPDRHGGQRQPVHRQRADGPDGHRARSGLHPARRLRWWSATPRRSATSSSAMSRTSSTRPTPGRAMARRNYKVSDYLKFHGEALVYKLDIPGVQIDNGGALPGNVPMIRLAHRRAAGDRRLGRARGGGSNPAVRPLLDSIRNSDGAWPRLGDHARHARLPDPQRRPRGWNLNAWRPFAYGGNPSARGSAAQLLDHAALYRRALRRHP